MHEKMIAMHEKMRVDFNSNFIAQIMKRRHELEQKNPAPDPGKKPRPSSGILSSFLLIQ